MSAPNPDAIPGHGVWRAARAVSMVLGVLGLVIYWGTSAVVFGLVWRYLEGSAPEPDAGRSFAAHTRTALQIASWAAITAHVLGMVVILKASRGKRKAGLVLNGLSLLLFLSMAILGWLWRR